MIHRLCSYNSSQACRSKSQGSRLKDLMYMNERHFPLKSFTVKIWSREDKQDNDNNNSIILIFTYFEM